MSDARSNPLSRQLVELARFPTAVLADAMGGENILPPSISSMVQSRSVAGHAYTVQLASGDNLGLHVAITKAHSGDIIVAACNSEDAFGLWGGILSLAAQRAGIAALVLDGFVRDRADLEASGVPVFARGVCIRKSAKKDPGQHQVEVVLGTARIRAGDFVVGDGDGIVVVAPEVVQAVLERAREIERQEAVFVSGLMEGRTTLDLLGLDDNSTSLPRTGHE